MVDFRSKNNNKNKIWIFILKYCFNRIQSIIYNYFSNNFTEGPVKVYFE